ncbi:MAG TPA: 2Fe-2S iron-sulfur cluster binding domain-containing protein [Nannocystis sp.]
MSARIRRGNLDLTLEPGETVLDALLRGGAEITRSCRAGVCQACMQRAIAGDPGAAAQQGLSPALQAQGYFLPCVARPTGELVIADGPPPSIGASVVDVTEIGARIVRVRLQPDEALAYRPGQFVQVIHGGLVRAYSLASVPETDAPLELHVRVHPHGQMSRRLAEARAGDRVELRGPSGNCFYTEGRPEQPILLAGTGTGLAPLQAIARDALGRGHTGPITLIHGALDVGGFYGVEPLIALAASAPNFRYVRCALSGEPAEGLEIGDLKAVVARVLPEMKGVRVFLCGDPELVAALKKQCFLRGASMRDISADAFLTAAPPVAA